MNQMNTPSPVVVKQEGIGLSIVGTRITIYDVMDYVKNDWPPKLIQQWLRLSEVQITGVMEYLTTHRDQLEAEYQQVLAWASEKRRYWEERNRERLAQIAALPPKPGQEQIRAKLAALKAELDLAVQTSTTWGK
jgi:uncharacterized protein (DUF433 family)